MYIFVCVSVAGFVCVFFLVLFDVELFKTQKFLPRHVIPVSEFCCPKQLEYETL